MQITLLILQQKYLLDKNGVQKSFWFISILLSAGLASKMILEIFDKWSADPVVVSFDFTLRHVSEIPFPAVTLCHTR